MTTLAIQGLAPKPIITVSEEAHNQKAAALKLASLCTFIGTPEQLRDVVDVIRRLKEITKTVEESRKAIKAPVLTLGRDIDSAASDFVEDLERESARLSRLAGAYQAEEQRKAREAEEARKREEERIERERLEAERKASEEADEKAKSAVTLEDLEKAEEERERAEEEARRKAAEATAATVISAPVSAPRVSSLATVPVTKFELTDINALYAARPDLVELVPKRAAINEAIKTNKSIPGLRIWEETQAMVRA